MLAVIFLTQISWGTIGLCGVLFVSQNNKDFRTLEAIVPSHSFAKNHSSPATYLLLNCKRNLFRYGKALFDKSFWANTLHPLRVKRFCFPRFQKRATFLLLFRSREKVDEQRLLLKTP